MVTLLVCISLDATNDLNHSINDGFDLCWIDAMDEDTHTIY